MALERCDVIVAELSAYIGDADGHVNKAAVREILEASHALASDLLELHNATGISLDNWAGARRFVQAFTGDAVAPNGA